MGTGAAEGTNNQDKGGWWKRLEDFLFISRELCEWAIITPGAEYQQREHAG